MKRTFVLSLLWVVVACMGMIVSGFCEEIERVVLLGGTLIDGTSADPMPNAVVVIEKDRIVAAGTADTVKIPENATQIPLQGATLLPGLINAHVHRGYEWTKPQSLGACRRPTVRDLAFSDMDVQWFELRDALLQDPRNARLVAVGPFITVPGGYPIQPWKLEAMTVTSPEDAAQKAERLLQQGANLLKIAIENGVTFGQTLPVLPLEEAAAIVAVAHQHGTRVSSHTTDSSDLVNLLKAEVDDIAHMVVDELSDELIAAVVQKGVYWVPTLELWHHVQQHPQSRQAEFTPHKNATSNLRNFVKAGGKVAFGTDYDGFDAVFDLGMPMLEIESMQQAGMTPLQIIVAATNTLLMCAIWSRSLGLLKSGRSRISW